MLCLLLTTARTAHHPHCSASYLQGGAPRDESKRILPVPGMPDQHTLLECLCSLTLRVEGCTDLHMCSTAQSTAQSACQCLGNRYQPVGGSTLHGIYDGYSQDTELRCALTELSAWLLGEEPCGGL
jgi:hypothetical protein